MTAEFDRLADIASRSRYSAGINETMVRESYRVLGRWLVDGPVLEVGPAEGHMTDLLVDDGHDLTVVEASERFCSAIAERHPKIEVVNSLVETFLPRRKFAHVVLGHVLEHVEDPRSTLELVATWLLPGGTIVAAVPNARSIHRQAAAILGLLADEHDLNEADVQHGHRRVFDPESFRSCFRSAGCSLVHFGGYWLKPLSNAQIEATWTLEMVRAFVELGERYPDIAAEIYVIARPNDALRGHSP